MSSSKLTFVAVITLISNFSIFCDPIRVTSFSCNTRNKRACTAKEALPISSKNIVPLFAA